MKNKFTIPGTLALIAFIGLSGVSISVGQVIFSEDFSSVTIADEISYGNPEFNAGGWGAPLADWTTPTTGSADRFFGAGSTPGAGRKMAIGFLNPSLDSGSYTLSADYSFDTDGTSLNAGANALIYFQALDWNGAGTAIQVEDRVGLTGTSFPSDNSTGNHTNTIYSQSVDLSSLTSGSGTITLNFNLPVDLDQSADAYSVGFGWELLGLTTSDTGASASFDNLSLSLIPEPSSTALLALAGIGLVFLRRRQKSVYPGQ